VSLLRRDLDLIVFPKDTIVFDEIRVGLFNWSQLAHTKALHHCKDAKARSPAMVAAAVILEGPLPGSDPFGKALNSGKL